MIICSFLIACALLKNTLFCYTAQQLVVWSHTRHILSHTDTKDQNATATVITKAKGTAFRWSGDVLYVHRSINSLSLSSATLGVVDLSNLEIGNFVFASDVA